MNADFFRRYMDIIEEAAAQIPAMPDITGMQPGQDRDLGGGSRLRLRPDGTVEYSGAWGTYRYNAQGQYLGFTSPRIQGHQFDTDAQGRLTKKTFSQGPVRQVQTDAGTDTSYDLGLGKVQQRRDAAGKVLDQNLQMREQDPKPAARKVRPLSDISDEEMRQWLTPAPAAKPTTDKTKAPVREGDMTPQTYPRRGLNHQQRQAPQMPAEFKPKKISVLRNKTDPQHPARRYYVGDSQQPRREPVEEERATEDMISTVRRGIDHYLRDLEQKMDPDRGLVDKAKKDLRRDDLDRLLPVKTVRTHDGRDIKIVGNERDGFRVKIGEQTVRSRFLSLEEAEMACEMYCNRRRNSGPRSVSQDYVEEDPATLSSVGRAAGRTTAKALPGVGTALSAQEALDRWQRGDRTGAVISTLAALGWLVPGPAGWVLGGSLEAANIARDLDEQNNNALASQARTRNIMARLRSQYPQARSDTEALLLHFEREQRQDRIEIDRLDFENDQEEADIDRLDRDLRQLKHRRGAAEALNPALSFENQAHQA